MKLLGGAGDCGNEGPSSTCFTKKMLTIVMTTSNATVLAARNKQ